MPLSCSSRVLMSVWVPPYRVEMATMWSPWEHSAYTAAVMAAMPLAKHTAARPPSKAAMRFSSTSTVGFSMRA